MRITAEWLEKHGCCEIDRFHAAYPDGVELTPENVEADTHGWDWGWLARRTLTGDRLDAYLTAIKPHWDAYLTARKPHWDACNAARKACFAQALRSGGAK